MESLLVSSPYKNEIDTYAKKVNCMWLKLDQTILAKSCRSKTSNKKDYRQYWKKSSKLSEELVHKLGYLALSQLVLSQESDNLLKVYEEFQIESEQVLLQ